MAVWLRLSFVNILVGRRLPLYPDMISVTVNWNFIHNITWSSCAMSLSDPDVILDLGSKKKNPVKWTVKSLFRLGNDILFGFSCAVSWSNLVVTFNVVCGITQAVVYEYVRF